MTNDFRNIPLMLAPMAGETNWAFRTLVQNLSSREVEGARAEGAGRVAVEETGVNGAEVVGENGENRETIVARVAKGESWLKRIRIREVEPNAPRADGSFGGPMPIITVSEMVNARAIVENNPRALKLMEFSAEETAAANPGRLRQNGTGQNVPGQDGTGQGDIWRGARYLRIVQLFSNNCPDLVNACRIIGRRQLADGIDLNLGCPVPKVTRRGGGSAIPWKLDLLEQMLSETRRITNDFGLKLSAKYRIGIDDQHTTFIDALKISETINLDFVTLHARTAVQFYGGSAEWSVFARALTVTETLPIFLNGDIFSGADALQLLTQLVATPELSAPSPSALNRIGLASARGALGRPWLFAEIRQSLARNSAVKIDKTFGEILSIAETHLKMLIDYYQNETLAAKSFRKHAAYYFKGFNLGPEVRRQLSSINSLTEFAVLGQQLSQRNPQLQTSQTLKRSKTRSQPRVHLPDGWLNSRTLR